MDIMTGVVAWLTQRRDDEAGQGLAEYALILALIAIVAIIALLFLGTQISDRLSEVGNAL
jgi:pilus assembly protein Flp/PilA